MQEAQVSQGLVPPRSANMPLRLGAYEVRLAESESEIVAAQRLRFASFYEEYGAIANAEQLRLQRDIDKYDEYCRHLLVIDVSNSEVVGTYRMLDRAGARHTGGFLSSDEYDLSKLLSQGGEVLELSRACIKPEHRLTSVMQLLWQGITSYVLDNDIRYMFGCASFSGTCASDFAEVLSYLHYHHLAPSDICPIAVEGRYISMDFMAKDSISKIHVLRQIPSVLKGYLRLGGWVGDGAVVDEVIRTVDTCIIVSTENIDERYYKHYTRKVRNNSDSDSSIYSLS